MFVGLRFPNEDRQISSKGFTLTFAEGIVCPYYLSLDQPAPAPASAGAWEGKIKNKK